MSKNQQAPFTLDEIKDAKIIVKAKGEYYSIVPKGGKEEAKNMQISILAILINFHFIANKCSVSPEIKNL